MTLSYTPEHEALRESVRKLLTEQASSERLRQVLESPQPYDATLWKTMAEELGLHGMAVPEEYGGSGFGFMEQAVVLEEMGRVVHCSPYLPTVVLAANALLLGDDEQARRTWLPRIASGEIAATVAVAEDDGDWHAGMITTTAIADGPEFRVTGRKCFVLDGATAGLVIVLARSGQDEVLAAVDTGQPGVSVDELPVLDQTRPMATVTFTDARGNAIATGARAREVLARITEIAYAALAAEQVGGAARVLEMAVEYAKTRRQFGVPIGSFQAIKFKAADMLLELEAARAAALYAARAVAEDTADRTIAATVAKAVCSDAYFAVAAENIQIHGGIGFTWEHDAHLYFKRAKSSELLFGNAAAQHERLARELGW
ncbi:acyl-CoA dehydrogenase family protein [Streptomyces sp. JNUCC 63]